MEHTCNVIHDDQSLRELLANLQKKENYIAQTVKIDYMYIV